MSVGLRAKKLQSNGTLDIDWVSSSVLARKFKHTNDPAHFSDRNFFVRRKRKKVV